MLSGGVCAILDYEVDQMTDYVAEMAQRVVRPGSPVSLPFRKFVSGLLSSTRLPSTTILLGMNYLARRVNMLNAVSTFSANEGQVWRLLTIGLLLGSKFLDDNTFQNRSWSEVSGISVSELNKMEAEWLVGIGWNLYVNLDESKDFKAWLQNWNDWRATKNLERSATLERLAPLPPIDTNVQRPRPYSQAFNSYAKSASREGPQSGFMPAYEQTAWVNNYPTPHLTPPSAPDSGLNTPDYLSATGGGPRYNDWALFNQYSRGYQQQPHATYVPTRVAAYHTPFTPYTPHYNNHYGGNIWDPNVADCSCNACSPHAKQQPYFVTHGYGGQLVVG